MGGIFGMCEGFAGAVEYQHSGTPHIHLKAHLVSVFQHKSIKEIACLIQHKLLDLNTIAEYTSWMCREEHFDQERHDASLEYIHQQWPNDSGEEHKRLGAMPSFITADSHKTMWDGVSEEDAMRDAERFKRE